jgi:hypothetical protein
MFRSIKNGGNDRQISDRTRKMSAVLSQLEREFTDMVTRIRRLEEIPVPSAAKLLKKTPQWVRDNLPVIYHSRKSHSVRLLDIEAYQLKRTVWPKGEFPKYGRRH